MQKNRKWGKFMRRKSKKSIFLCCCAALALIIFVVKIAVEHKAESTKSSAASANLSVLSYKKNGSVSYDENEYFQKYIIKCKSDVSSINEKESGDSIFIYVNKQDIANTNISTNNKLKTKGITVDSSGGTLRFAIHKNYKDNNFAYIDSLDSKNIIIIVSKKKDPYKYKVVLDPGHGGNDKGTNIGTLYEKDITLKIVKDMTEFLRYNGCSLVYTREVDKWVDYKIGIPNLVNSSNADVFVSIHINAYAQSSKYNGISAYYYDPDGYQKDERIKLASLIQDEVVKSDGWFNRGITRSALHVLKYSKIPCVLVECGFMTNPDDRKRMTDDQVLKRLANNISNGVVEYLNTEVKK